MRHFMSLLSVCIFLSVSSPALPADEINKNDTVKPSSGIVSEVNIQDLVIIIEFTEMPLCKPGDVIDVKNAKGTFPVTVEEISVTSVICSVPRYSITHIKTGDSAAITPASSKKITETKTNEDQTRSQRKRRKIDRPRIFFYGRTNTSDFQSTSAIYEKQPGVLFGGVQIALDNNRNGFDVQYKKPSYSGKEAEPKDAIIAAFFSTGEVNGRIAYHRLDDPKKFNTSHYFEGNINLNGNQLFFKPVLSYQQKYYMDDYSGERKKYGDYQTSCKVSPLHVDDSSFHFSLDVSAHYVSEQYADMSSTPQNEGRKGFRDALGDIWVGIGSSTMMKTGFTYTRIINENWRSYTGSSQYLWYLDFRMAFDALYITLRYDHVRQPNGSFEKKKNLYTAGFRYSI
jgi:hypothetical protein